ncbi:hypothetical protein NYE24_17445 [Paenibacillus sp. FSL H7-0350]|uniref:hypothetical protein n=2 Tax=Paenibacillus TaxID=44249 RepID=UPI0004B7ACEC
MEKELVGVVNKDILTKLTYTYHQKKDIMAAAEKVGLKKTPSIGAGPDDYLDKFEVEENKNELHNKAEGKKTVRLNDENTGKWILEAFLRRTI